jgi:EmrB/QacA subfamily drug resistance transporter
MPHPGVAASRQRTAADGAPRRSSASRRLLANPSLLLPVILTAQLMVVLDSTIVNVALPHIQASLHFSSTSLSWVLNAYILTFGGLLLLGARAGDLLGRRRTFLAGIALFTVSSLAGGFSTAGWMLLSTRALQGIGGALAAPASLALLTTAFPDGALRVRAIGLYTTVSAAGGAIGLVAGGLLTELVSWRWVMFVNVPIGIAVLLTGRLVLAETERRHGRFDLGGAITSTLGVSGIVLGLVEAGTGGWTDPWAIGPVLAGGALLGAFVWNERRAEEPVLPLRLFAHGPRTAANAARGFVFAGMYGMFFFLSQFLQDVQGFSPLRAGVAFLPMPVSVFLSSQVTSRVLVQRFRPKVLMLTGIAMVVGGVLLASRVGAGTSYGVIVAQLVLVGAGTGMSVVSLTTASLADVAPEDAGAASGLINVTQQLGAALGVAALVTVFGSVTRHAQLSGASAAATGAAARGVQAVLVHGIDDAFRVGAVFAVAALTLVAVVIRSGRRPAGGAPASVPARGSDPVPQPWEAIEPLAATADAGCGAWDPGGLGQPA